MIELISTLFSCSHLRKDVMCTSVYIPIIAGTICSIWTSSIFINTLAKHLQDVIRDSLPHTHLILLTAVTIGFFYGVKQKQRYFLLPWIQLKICESILLIPSLIWIFLSYHFLQLALITITVLLINLLVTYLVWKYFKTVVSLPPSYEENEPRKEVKELPSYDDTIHQSANV